jgi:hypothetical protein
MNIRNRPLVTALLGAAALAWGIPSLAGDPVQIHAKITRPVAGIDYPTDSPPPSGILILELARQRLRVPASAKLVRPTAGVDYPTDSPVPAWAKVSRTLVLENAFRLPLIVEKAEAGVDFPTDGPPGLDRDFLILAVDGGERRVPIRDIAMIEMSVAGIDYPTDAPSEPYSGRFVIVTLDGSRIMV